MTDPIQIEKVKLNTLENFFTELGYQTTTKLSPDEFLLFLNKKSKTGRFDPILTEKLFHILSLDEISSLSIKEFIHGFLEFEEDIKKNAELFSIKLAQEQEIYDKILKQCRSYQSEKLNAEGFCENAKISGEITDIDIRQKLEGIKEIIIIVIYNKKREELHFKIGDKNSQQMLKKSFSFKPTSRSDHFEFIMKGINEKDQIFDIGSKVFPLNDIGSQEEYLVQIIIPEMGKPDKVAAYINAIIVLYMSDFKYYEALRRKQEKRVKKFMVAANKASEYLKYVREIYGDLSQMEPDLIVNFNNEKLMKRKGVKLNVNFKNKLEGETPENNYFVEFNNEREVQKKAIPLRIEFNNSKEVASPVIETKNYEYKYNISSSINQEKINNIEKRIETLQKEKDNFYNRLQNIPKPNLEQINIKKTTENILIKNQEQQNNDIPKNISPSQIFSNQQIIKKQIKNTQQIIQNKTIEPKLVEKQPNYNPQILQKVQQTSTEKTQNIYSPPYILQNPPVNKNKVKFDLNSFLKTNTNTQTTQIHNKNISLNNNTSQNSNTGAKGMIQQTTKVTQTAIKAPSFSQSQSKVQNINQNIQSQTISGKIDADEFIKSFLSGENLDKYYIENSNTTTEANMANTIENGQYQIEQEIENETNEKIRLSEFDIIGEIKKEKTITAETKILAPIINKIQVNNSYNQAILGETTNEIVMAENTLPISYLPEKVNNIIVEDKIGTLPIINTTINSGTYKTLEPIIHEPIIHEPKIVYVNENSNISNFNNTEIIENNTNSNLAGNNYGIEYNFNTNGKENINNNFQINESTNNNLITTQTTETTKIIQTSQNNPAFNAPVEDSNFVQRQQI